VGFREKRRITNGRTTGKIGREKGSVSRGRSLKNVVEKREMGVGQASAGVKGRRFGLVTAKRGGEELLGVVASPDSWAHVSAARNGVRGGVTQ